MVAISREARPSPATTVYRWLRSYLFRPGGAYAIAICRIALFGYLYWHVVGDAFDIIANGASYLARANIASYYPKSIVWLLFPSSPPPAWVIDAVLRMAQISTMLALVGLATRPAMIVSTLSCLFLGSLIFSWEPLWSHPYNSGLLAALGFMFGRAGDTLSIDAVLARYGRGRPISLNRDVYWWPVILGQFGVATVYFGGFYAKWSTPDFTYDLAWVFSDNLRNSVVLPWLIRGQQLPWNVDLLVNTPWLWKLAAFGHLATQALPILALASLNRPWIRLLEGSVFAAGVVLLKLVMGMWNIQWLILTAFFVDWEFFLKKLGFMPQHSGPAIARPSRGGAAVVGFAAIFFVVNMAVIVTRFDDTGMNRFYPLSSMGFYSGVLAKKPYGEHQHFPFTYGEVVFTQPDGTSRKWNCAPGIASSYLATYASADDADGRAERQASALRAILASADRVGPAVPDCEGIVDAGSAASVDLFSTIFNIPPYPERARFAVGHRALVSRFEKAKGRLLAASSQAFSAGNTAAFRVTNRGFNQVRYEILFANDPWKNREIGPLIPVAGTWSEEEFKVDAEFYAKLPSGAFPVIVRCIEPGGSTYDFFGGVLYR